MLYSLVINDDAYNLLFKLIWNLYKHLVNWNIISYKLQKKINTYPFIFIYYRPLYIKLKLIKLFFKENYKVANISCIMCYGPPGTYVLYNVSD